MSRSSIRKRVVPAHARRAAGLLAFLLFAPGCLEAATPEADPAAADLLPPTLAFDAPVLTTRDPGGSENFIAVSADGRVILTCIHNTYTASARLTSSTDGGKSFRVHAPLPEPFLGGDCEIALDRDGAWYLFSSNTAMSTSVATSRDEGKTWSATLLFSQPTNSATVALANDRTWAVAQDGNVYVTHMTPYILPNQVGMTISRDHGRTWSLTKDITRASPTETNAVGRPLILSTGRIVVPMVRDEAPNNGEARGGRLMLAYSDDEGVAWNERVVRSFDAGLKFFTPIVSAAGGDVLYWPYRIDHARGSDLMLLVSTDAGETWSQPRLIAKNFGPNSHWWSDGRPDGTATLLWTTDGAAFSAELRGNHLMVGRVATDPSAAPILMPVGPVSPNEFVSVDHDCAGNAYITYSNATSVWTRPQQDGGVQFMIRERGAAPGPC